MKTLTPSNLTEPIYVKLEVRATVWNVWTVVAF
jgi:hypothetical protein